jgi:hypothetical protein
MEQETISYLKKCISQSSLLIGEIVYNRSYGFVEVITVRTRYDNVVTVRKNSEFRQFYCHVGNIFVIEKEILPHDWYYEVYLCRLMKRDFDYLVSKYFFFNIINMTLIKLGS